MSVQVIDNFSYKGKKGNFERDNFDTLQAMRSYPEDGIDDGHVCFCNEDGNHYKFNHLNSVDGATGRWRLHNKSVNTLTETGEGKVLDARQGKILKDLIDAKVIEAGGVSFDTVPTKNSINPVTSNGIKEAMDEQAESINANTGVDDYPVFSASEAYSKGKVVNYNGKLYKFTADHAAGAWIGTDVEGTSMADNSKTAKVKLEDLDTLFTGSQSAGTAGTAMEIMTGLVPTVYDVMGSQNVILGKLFAYSDSMRHVITQVLFTSMTLNDNGALIDTHNDGITHMYYRTYGVMAPSLTNGKWTEWKQIVTELDGGTYMQTLEPGDTPITSLSNFNRCENHIYFASTSGTYTKAGNIVVEDGELALIFWSWRTKAFSKKTIYKTTIVQETGDSETAVMSQKAVTEKLNVINDKFDNQISEIEAAKDAALNEIEDTEQEAILNFSAQRVTPEMLSEGVKQLIETAGGGTINNLPDEEDITSTGGDMPVLKFKDKEYNPANFSGLGRVYLRKNIVDGKNILTQDMINKENTEYIIQYDYYLNGEEITIPNGCILKFENGSFNNGTILGNKTDLINPNFNNIECKNIKENNNIDKIIYDTNGQAYPAFPKLNKGQYIITAYGDNSNVGQVTINGYNEDDSIIYSFKIKYSSDGYTQLIDISDYPDNIYRFVVVSTLKYLFKINKYINNAKVLKVYDTFNDMNNDDTLSYGDICYIKGYHKKYDDGDSFWCIENISSKYSPHTIINVIGGETAATKSYINATNIVLQNGLRAILICKDKKINVLKIGLKNNGEDCTEQLKNIIPKLAQGDCLYFPGGRYYFTDTIDFGDKNIFIEGETNINIGDNSYTANSSPYWQSDFNNSIVQSKDNGNSITIFRFNFGTNTDKTCIRSNASSYISNVVITNNSFDFEGVYGGTNLNPPVNPLTGVIKYENINALDGFTNITNCGFSGFSGRAINNINYGYINNVRFYKCNIGIYAGFDCMITNIRASSCNTIMYNYHLNQINNVRGDSIAGHVFVVRGSGCIYANIEIDYCKKSCFNLVERGDYCTIKSNCLRVQTNSWNNNVDNKGTVKLDECFIHVKTPVRGLNIEINLLDAHATDAGNHPDYNKYIIYPCILGVENNINHLNAIIYYGGSYNDADKQDITINRLLQLKSDCYINGKIICNNEIYLFNNYALGGTYYKNYIYHGTTDSRPNNLTKVDIGFQYFDTTLNKPIYWNGTKWVGLDGNDVDATPVTSGTFANKPTGVDVGYAYFCTDKQTTEGTTNGIMIYYKGGNVWVDALGRVVS